MVFAQKQAKNEGGTLDLILTWTTFFFSFVIIWYLVETTNSIEQVAKPQGNG